MESYSWEGGLGRNAIGRKYEKGTDSQYLVSKKEGETQSQGLDRNPEAGMPRLEKTWGKMGQQYSSEVPTFYFSPGSCLEPGVGQRL